MSNYIATVQMAGSQSLRDRITACAAVEGEADPTGWTNNNVWKIITQPGWQDNWQYAVDNANDNVNPDTGRRTDVISDAEILSAVQAVRAEQPA